MYKAAILIFVMRYYLEKQYYNEVAESIIRIAEYAAVGETAASEVMGLQEGIEVENTLEAEMAEAPAVENEASAISKRQGFFINSTYGKFIVDFSKWIVETTATAAVFVGVTYGLNKLLDSKAQETGKRMPASEYLKLLEANYKKIGVKWTDDVKQDAAIAALQFPWIDCTK